MIIGCGEKPKSFIPSMDSAEEAVRRGMEAWKSGEKVGEVMGNPRVYVTDNSRRKNQVLQSYRILGETPGKSGRTIAVTLQMSNPAEEIKARYIVVGIDPIWVFRQEDYELLMHWEHPMVEPEVPQKQPKEGDQQSGQGKGGDESNSSTREEEKSKQEPPEPSGTENPIEPFEADSINPG